MKVKLCIHAAGLEEEDESGVGYMLPIMLCVISFVSVRFLLGFFVCLLLHVTVVLLL